MIVALENAATAGVPLRPERSGEAVFETALRESVTSAQRKLERAQLEAEPAQVQWHAARLLDLLDRARVNGIDTTGWVPAATMAVVIASAAE